MSATNSRPGAGTLWLTLAVAATALLAACGGGGSDAQAPSPPPSPSPSPSPAPVSQRWVSTAPQVDLNGGADSGIDGPLRVIDPTRPASLTTVTPAAVDSTALRVSGGQVDATLGSVTGAAPRFVVYDAALPAGGASDFALYKLALDSAGTAPQPQRLSTESAICGGLGARFTMLGQSLAGDSAVFHYRSPTATLPCSAGGEPRVVTLSMTATSTPIALPAADAERTDAIGPVHGSNGQIAAFLAWQGDRFVRTDGTLGNPVALAGAELGGPVDAGAAPRAPGIVTRFGVFVLSQDGLRRYDKSTGRLSALLVAGRVGSGVQVGVQHDDAALYVTVPAAAGGYDLYRVTDALAPVVTQLNTEGPLLPIGLRLTKSYVLYAVEGRNDWVAWRKADGQRSNVLDGREIELASTLHDRVFHSRTDAGGAVTLASSAVDGSAERSLGSARLLSAALAESMSPFARTLRRNGPFEHAVVVVPAAGAGGLAGAAVRWLAFDAAGADLDGGSLPVALDGTLEAPGIIGSAGLFAVKAAAGAARLFVTRRSAGAATLSEAGAAAQ